METVKSLKLPSCYVEVTDNEMEYLDGSKWGWRQWTAAGLIALGAICVVVSIFIPPTSAGTMTLAAKLFAAAGAVLSAGGGILAIS